MIPLIPLRCKEIILHLFAGLEEIKRKEIEKGIDEERIKRGWGQGEQSLTRVTTRALEALVKEKKAISLKGGLWSFPKINNEVVGIYKKKEIVTEKSNSINIEATKIVGSTNLMQTVYVYYYPAYKELAELKGEKVWRCKIGRTDSADPIFRIEDQTKTHIQEKPLVPLMIRTSNSYLLEKMIHDFLKFRDMKCKDSIGTEWYNTNPNEVEKIAKLLDPDLI
jgi:hypothetical protein